MLQAGKLTGIFGRNFYVLQKFEYFGISEIYKFSGILALRDFYLIVGFSRNLVLREFASIFFLFIPGIFWYIYNLN